jgi:broad specificity phosphatase PhoE
MAGAFFRRHWQKGAFAVGMSPVVAFVAYPILPDDWHFTNTITEVIASRVRESELRRWMAGGSRPNRIILVRHAQTHGYSHTCTCQVEGLPVCAMKPEMERPLTEEGKLQALATGVALREIIGSETVFFVSSPYKACKQTFQYISGSFNESGVRYAEDPRLRNQYFGDWTHTETPEVKKQLESQQNKVGAFYYKWPQGESAADVYDRVCSFMETLYRKWEQPMAPQNFVIITHNVVMLCFLMRWFHWDVETFHRLKRFNGAQIAVMEKQPDGSYRLISPLPCDPPMPQGVREIAANPTRRTSALRKQ